MDASAARELEPALSPAIAGAAVSPMDGQVNPIRLAQALGLGVRRLGGRLLTHTTVTGIRLQGSRVVGVETSRGRIAADAVVNAAGVCAPASVPWSGSPFPSAPAGDRSWSPGRWRRWFPGA